MSRLPFAVSAIVGAGYFLSISSPSLAECVPVDSFTSSSEGLSLTVTRSYPHQNNIDIQFSLRNNRAQRVYIRDARSENSQKAFISSGEQLQWPNIVGIELCDGALSQCVRDGYSPDVQNLNSYSYIEPGARLSFSFRYQSRSAVSDTDAISFSVPLAARFSPPNGDPSTAGSARQIRFNFSGLQLNCH